MASPGDGAADLAGRVAVLTTLGADAVGEEMIAQLLTSNIARLYVLAPAEEQFAAISEELSIRQDLSEEGVASVVEFVPCDLASIRSSADAAQALLRKLLQLRRIDLLFCHASCPAPSAPRFVQDGVESTFATDYLGHFVLVNILLPLIEQTAADYQQARVIVSTSYLYTLVQHATLDSFTAKEGSDDAATSSSSSSSHVITSYAQSQLAKILLTRYIAKLEHDSKGYSVFSNCFDATDIQPDLLGDSIASLPAAIFRKSGQGPEGAAATAMNLAASPGISDNNISGQYFGGLATQAQLDGAAVDNDLMNNLWYWSDHKVSEVLGKGWEDAGKGILGGSPATPPK